LGPDPNDEGDLYQGAQDASPTVESDHAPAASVDTDANILASRVVVDDAATSNISRIVLIAAVLAVGIAFGVALAK
jgi:hypothetical protein